MKLRTIFSSLATSANATGSIRCQWNSTDFIHWIQNYIYIYFFSLIFFPPCLPARRRTDWTHVLARRVFTFFIGARNYFAVPQIRLRGSKPVCTWVFASIRISTGTVCVSICVSYSMHTMTWVYVQVRNGCVIAAAIAHIQHSQETRPCARTLQAPSDRIKLIQSVDG